MKDNRIQNLNSCLTFRNQTNLPFEFLRRIPITEGRGGPYSLLSRLLGQLLPRAMVGLCVNRLPSKSRSSISRLKIVLSLTGQSSPGSCTVTMSVSPTKVGPVSSQRIEPCPNGMRFPAFAPWVGMKNIQLLPKAPSRVVTLPVCRWEQAQKRDRKCIHDSARDSHR